MPIGPVDIFVFEERGGGQQNVGIIYGVGKELLMHNREQVGPQEPAHHIVVIGRDHRGVGVVNKHRLDRRILQAGKGLAQFRHIDHPRGTPQRALHHQIGSFQRLVIEGKRPAG